MVLPLLLSIPHCGIEVPPFIADTMALNPAQVAESEDHGTREIFSGLPSLACVAARWSRLVADLNRRPDRYDDRGVIALADYFGRRVFKLGQEPDPRETRQRVEAYHRPYHRELTDNLALPGLRLLLDCHSMDGVGPSEAPDPGRVRCDVSLGNRGGPDGEAIPGKDEATCPASLIRGLARALEAQGLSVSLNQPYSGGYITKHYGGLLREQGKSSLQIELNTDLYLTPQLAVDPVRLDQTRQAVWAALKDFARLL
ncbi:hypothetical protein AAU61_17660 [Desulfocarbo indianensis]|nr:hypothetical protein AAU61_17660 [Desulfocarbo indianensis]